MSLATLILALSTPPVDSVRDVAAERNYYEFCERSGHEIHQERIAACLEIAELLRQAELEVIAAENNAKRLFLECSGALKKESALDRLKVVLAEDMPTHPTPVEKRDCDTSSIDNLKDKDLAKLRTPQAKFLLEERRAQENRRAFVRYLEAFKTNQRNAVVTDKGDTYRSFGDPSTGPIFVDQQRDRDKTDLANLNNCKLSDAASDALLVSRPRGCIDLAEAIGDPLVRWSGGPEPSRPSGLRVLPKIEIGKSSSNGQILLSDTLTRSAGTEVPDWEKRRPYSISWSAGAEVAVKDGVGAIIRDNADEANFFSRERLNTSLAAVGSLGVNFFPTQTIEQFDRRRENLFVDLRAECEKSLTQKSTNIETDCSDGRLLAWLFERKDGKYIRAARVEEYKDMIWRASAKHPAYGYGITARAGLPSRDYYDFTDADGKFQPSLVDVDNFFSANPTTRLATVGPKLAYQLGAYGYKYFPGAFGFKGITARFDLGRRFDIQDLDKKTIEICRLDLIDPAIPVVNESARCRSGILPFQPEFETSWIPKAEIRVLTKHSDRFGSFGFAPSVRAKIRPGDDDVLTFEFPVYYSQADGKLSSGLKYVHSIDYADDESKAAGALLLFLSSDLTLDGSK